MIPIHSSARWFGLLARAVFLAPLLAGALFAQPATGSVSGRVSDAATGRSLRGAVISVAGTPILEYSDSEGRYTLAGVPAGTHRIEVEYVGLDSLAGDVMVVAGETVTFNAPLASTALQLETFTVSEQARGQALAINQQRTASGIVNIVSEETFGAMVDGNIGTALQRLPGLSVNENQDGTPSSINIRGIAGEFNSFQIDGNRVPAAGNSHAFDARTFAADGVTNIEVIKAPTPDRDGDAIGGIVNVISRSAFQRDGRAVKLRAAGVLNEEPNNWGYAGTLSYSDLYSVGSGEKNLGVSFSVGLYETDRYSLNSDQDWVQVTPENNPDLNLDQYDIPVWFMESTHWEYSLRTTNTQTFSSSIDFRTDDDNSFYFRPVISRHTREGLTYETDINIDTRFQDDPDGRKTYAELTPNYGRGTPGDDGSRGTLGWVGTALDDEDKFYSLNFGGRHERGPSVITYDLFTSRSKRTVNRDNELNMVMEPDDPYFLFEYEVDHPFGDVRINQLNPDELDPRDLSLVDEGELIVETSEKTEDVFSARADWEREFALDRGEFSVKTGAKYRSSEPEFDRSTDVYATDDTFPYAQVMDPTDAVEFLKPKYYDAQPDKAEALLASNPELYEFQEEDSLEDSNISDYAAKEETSAAYVMGTYQFGRHTVIGGVRFERIEWQNTNKLVSYLDGEASVTTVDRGSSESFWLPGLHLRHALTPKLILRESVYRSYARARLSELSRGRFVNEDGDISDGNPDLKPAESDNLDLQLEYYTDHGGLYSVGFFYKDITNFSYDQVYDFNELDANGIPIPAEDGDFEYERPVNGTSAKNYGVELIARQRLVFLPGPLKGFSVALSATFTESEAEYPNRTDGRDLPLPGFSDYLFTGTVEYVWRNFSARVDYRYRGDYVEGLGSDIESDEFYAAEERVDAELGYRLARGLLIFANATNLTDRGQISYQGYPPFVEDASFAGTKYTFGVEYSF
ncbi:MAG TPA: TonB-dependent receptor [Opitutaceae bacterium]